MKYSIRLFFLILTLQWGGAVAQKAHPTSPNILFILTDDLGYGDIGVLYQNRRKEKGLPSFETPHLDALANSGMILSRHYVPAPVCAPSRASLILGLHQGHANVRNNQFDKAIPDNHTVGSVLKAAGYTTALIGKWGLQGLKGDSPETWQAYPTKRGFDYFFGYVHHKDGHNHYPAHKARKRPPSPLYEGNDEISEKLTGCYTTDLFTAAAKKWIVSQKKKNPDKPFFLELAYDTPHASLQVAPSPYPKGGGLNGGIQWIGKKGRYINTADESIDDYYYPEYSKKNWKDYDKRFASMVRRIDNAVGDIIKLLQDLNIDKETLIVFTSDNGPHDESYGYGDYDPTFFRSFGDFNGIKRDSWEGGIRVPAFVSWPGVIPSGTTNNSPSEFYDWLPTFADIAHIPAPANSDGVSLLPVLSKNSKKDNGIVYIEYYHQGNTPNYKDFGTNQRGNKRGEMQVLYLDGYKGIRYNIDSAQDDFQIFKTESDPEEKNNLAGSNNYFIKLEQRMKDKVLQIRIPDSSAVRPYDKEPIPSDNLKEENLIPGLTYLIADSMAPWVPDLQTINTQILNKGIIKKLNLPSNGIDLRNKVVDYTGYLKIPETGKYRFSIITDRGAVMKLHNSVIIDADKEYQSNSLSSVILNLEKGYHSFHLTYIHQEGESSLDFKATEIDEKDSKPIELSFYHD